VVITAVRAVFAWLIVIIVTIHSCRLALLWDVSDNTVDMPSLRQGV
jgi:hypothetical protein